MHLDGCLLKKELGAGHLDGCLLGKKLALDYVIAILPAVSTAYVVRHMEFAYFPHTATRRRFRTKSISQEDDVALREVSFSSCSSEVFVLSFYVRLALKRSWTMWNANRYS